MTAKREALVVCFVLAGAAFGAISAGAGVAGSALEQLANAFSDGSSLIDSDTELADELKGRQMGFRA